MFSISILHVECTVMEQVWRSRMLKESKRVEDQELIGSI